MAVLGKRRKNMGLIVAENIGKNYRVGEIDERAGM
jgi:hypothetical protein